MVILLTMLAYRTWHPLQVAVGSPNGGPSDPTLQSCQRNAGQTSIDPGRKNHKRILDIGRDPSTCISAFSSDLVAGLRVGTWMKYDGYANDSFIKQAETASFYGNCYYTTIANICLLVDSRYGKY